MLPITHDRRPSAQIPVPATAVLLGALTLTALTWAAQPASAHAEDRSRSNRVRLELAFDHGYGFSSEDGYAELATDLRLYAPNGFGAALRTGAAVQGLSNALALELGVAARLDLLADDHFGLQLAGALGPSLAYGPFDGGSVFAFGGWAAAHLDFWHRNFFVGLGVSGHALISERYGQPGNTTTLEEPGRAAPILSLTPMVRIGGDWGL